MAGVHQALHAGHERKSEHDPRRVACPLDTQRVSYLLPLKPTYHHQCAPAVGGRFTRLIETSGVHTEKSVLALTLAFQP
jgi:hypothetical protein